MSSLMLSMMPGKFSRAIFAFLVVSLVTGRAMYGCGSSGSGASDALPSPPRQSSPQQSPTAVFIEGRAHDGEFTPLADALCDFMERQSGQEISHTSTGPDGAFLLILPVDVTGFLRCNPRSRPQLALSAFITTQGQFTGSRMIENVTPASTVIADNIMAANGMDPQGTKVLMQRSLALGDPDLMALVDAMRLLFNAMVAGNLDSTVDFSGDGEGDAGGADGGGAGGEAGDGGEFSPIPGAVCTFSQDRDGLVRANTVFADFVANGLLDRTDLQPIADQVNQAFDAEQRQVLTQAFAKWFPSGLGEPISTIADGPASATPGHFFLPLPVGVPGVIRCHPPEQENLTFDTCVRARMDNESLIEQRVTPGTSMLCDLATEARQADPRIDRETIKTNLESRLDPLLIFLSEDRNGNGVQDPDERDKNEDNTFSTNVELKSLEPLNTNSEDLALLVSTATTIFDFMRIRGAQLPEDRTFEEARRDFFIDAQFESDLFALTTDVEGALDAENNLAVLGTNDVVGAATTGTLLGTVTDAGGAPVADAQVILSQKDVAISGPMATDSDGRFRIADIPVEDTTITVLKDGFQLLRKTTAVVAIVNIDLTLQPVPQIAVSPSAAFFGDVKVGSVRKIDVHIANTGTADLTLLNTTLNAEAMAAGYTLGRRPTSSVTITPGSEVVVKIFYKPQAVGKHLGALTIDSDAQDEPVNIALVGSGVPQPVPQIATSDDRVRFGKVDVGSSRTRFIILSNTGTAKLTISRLAIAPDGSQDFAVRDQLSLPAVLPPEGTLKVYVRYRPSTVGLARGALEIDSNDANAPNLTVPLQGQGKSVPIPQIEASTNVLAFDEVPIPSGGGADAGVAKPVEIFNTGQAPLTITAVRVDASQGQAFKLQKDLALPIVVTPDSSVTIGIVYEAAFLGPVTGRLRLRSNAENTSELTVGLRATGVAQAQSLPQLTLSTPEISFGDVQIGKTRSRFIMLSNTGTGPLSIQTVGIDPIEGTPFALSQAPPASFVIQPGVDGVELKIDFTPQSTGSFFNVLRITSGTDTEPLANIPLSGSGVAAPTPELMLSASALMFGDVPVGEFRIQTLDVSNLGTADLIISALPLEASEPGAFELVDGPSLPAAVKPGVPLSLTLRYQPTQEGPTTGTLRIEHNALGSASNEDGLMGMTRQMEGSALGTAVDVVTLNGTGTSARFPVIDVRPMALSFGPVFLESVNPKTQQIAITNTGDAALTISRLQLGPNAAADFALPTVPVFPIMVPPGATFILDVTYWPTMLGPAKGTVEIVSDATNGDMIVVPLDGMGEAAQVANINVDPRAIDYGKVELESSQTQTITVTNTGAADLTVMDWNLPDSDFAFAQPLTLPSVIPPNESVKVDVTYTPSTVGPATETLEIVSNAGNESPVEVELSGTGEPVPTAQIDAEPATLDFGDVATGSRMIQPVAVRNVGTADLMVFNVLVTGGDFALAQAFSESVVILPGKFISLDIVFAPTAEGFVMGTLEIQSNVDDEQPTIVSLTGTGQADLMAKIAVNPDSVDFGEVDVGTLVRQTVTIHNEGASDLTGLTLDVTGEGFDLESVPSESMVIESKGSVQIVVTYQPKASASDAGALILQINDPDTSEVSVSLKGTGIGAPGAVDQPTEPVDQPSEPVDQPSEPVDQPTPPVDQPSEPVDQPSEPVEQPSEPVEQPSEPVEQPSEPVDQPTPPVDQPSNIIR